MNFLSRPFRRLQRSYADVYDHYVDFWRFRLSGPDRTSQQRRATSLLPRNTNQLSNVFMRLFYNPFKKLWVGDDYKAQRRSSGYKGNPHHRRRHHDETSWGRSSLLELLELPAQSQYEEEYIEAPHDHQESRSLKEEGQCGPPPSVPSAEETVVKPQHQSSEK